MLLVFKYIKFYLFTYGLAQKKATLVVALCRCGSGG
jgi:hypothetical protein